MLLFAWFVFHALLPTSNSIKALGIIMKIKRRSHRQLCSFTLDRQASLEGSLPDKCRRLAEVHEQTDSEMAWWFPYWSHIALWAGTKLGQTWPTPGKLTEASKYCHPWQKTNIRSWISSILLIPTMHIWIRRQRLSLSLWADHQQACSSGHGKDAASRQTWKSTSPKLLCPHNYLNVSQIQTLHCRSC